MKTKNLSDEEIVLKSIIKSEDNSLVLNRYMSVDNFKAYIIFSHEFCKAFFGEENINFKEVYKVELEQKGIEKIGYNSDKPWFDWEQNWTLEFPKWKLHLREMVLEEKPLKYLEKFL